MVHAEIFGWRKWEFSWELRIPDLWVEISTPSPPAPPPLKGWGQRNEPKAKIALTYINYHVEYNFGMYTAALCLCLQHGKLGRGI